MDLWSFFLLNLISKVDFTNSNVGTRTKFILVDLKMAETGLGLEEK